jgi:hypothetical protein
MARMAWSISSMAWWILLAPGQPAQQQRGDRERDTHHDQEVPPGQRDPAHGRGDHTDQWAAGQAAIGRNVAPAR